MNAPHAIGRDVGVNQFRVEALEAFIVQAQPLGNAGAKVLHHDVGPAGKLFADRPALRGFHFQGHAAFVAIDGQKIVTADLWDVGVESITDIHVARRVAALGLFDLDDLGAQVAQDHRAIGTGHAVGQVKYFDTFERSAHFKSSLSIEA